MKRWVILLSLLLAVPFATSCGGVSQEEYAALQSKYTALQKELADMKNTDAERVLALEAEEEPLKMPELPYHMKFSSADVATMGFRLGKGDQFAARITIPRGSVIFWVRDPWYRQIVDPGTISGVYEFTFIAERSGQYAMTFDDARGHVTIDMVHNFGETFAK